MSATSGQSPPPVPPQPSPGPVGLSAGEADGEGECSAVGRILDLLDLPQILGGCAGGPPRLLRNKNDPNRLLVVRPACGSWHCGVCASRLRILYGARLGARLLASERAWHRSVGSAGWLAFKRASHRAGVPWCRVLGTGGVSEVFAGRSFAAAVELGSDDAVCRLGAALAAIAPPIRRGRGGHFLPVTACRAWQGQPAEEVAWDQVECRFNRRRPEEVRKVLAECGIDPRSCAKSAGHAWAFSGTLPSPAALPALVVALSGNVPFGPLGPPGP